MYNVRTVGAVYDYMHGNNVEMTLAGQLSRQICTVFNKRMSLVAGMKILYFIRTKSYFY